MSINIWTDSMQHAALLGKPVLFTNWLIQRDIIPDGWYCYDLRGTHKSPSTRTTLVDHAADYHAGTVLSPIPLKHEGMEIGSMAGWDVPGADPKHYEESYSGQTSCANFEQKQ